MELRQLKYFVAVARTLSFSEAARQLYVTQGTLSQQIMLLEDELGSLLFERTSHKVALTEPGMVLFPLAKNIIQQVEQCKLQVGDLRKALGGELNIGMTYSFSNLITDTVRDFLKTYPGVKLRIYYKTASELYQMMVKGELDVILAFKPVVQHKDLVSETLFNFDLCAVMRKDHPLSDRKVLTLEELKNFNIALPGSGLQARKTFEKFNNIDTNGLNVRVELNDPNVIMDLVQSSNLVTILSSLAALYRPNLAAVPLEGYIGKMEGCVHWLKGAYHKKSAEAFIEMVRESAAVSKLL
ncbi:MAG: LysR family transcriptional regulator [Bacteroidales bacterium]|nr:LysR family transcriptional regulator [Bacteroidales bacterium]